MCGFCKYREIFKKKEKNHLSRKNNILTFGNCIFNITLKKRTKCIIEHPYNKNEVRYTKNLNRNDRVNIEFHGNLKHKLFKEKNDQTGNKPGIQEDYFFIPRYIYLHFFSYFFLQYLQVPFGN